PTATATATATKIPTATATATVTATATPTPRPTATATALATSTATATATQTAAPTATSTPTVALSYGRKSVSLCAPMKADWVSGIRICDSQRDSPEISLLRKSASGQGSRALPSDYDCPALWQSLFGA